MEEINKINIANFAKLAKTNSNEKAPLGRGLSALLGDINSATLLKDNNNQVMQILISDCIASKYQARLDFEESSLQELASSIKKNGVIQPIAVRKISDNPVKYEIIAGERRLRASSLAGLKHIPAIIMSLSDKEVMEVGLIENLQRKDLNPIEEATAYQKLYKEFNYSHEEIAEAVGKSRSYITNYLRVLTLPDSVISLIKNGSLTTGHAKMLVNVENPEALAQEIVNQRLSVQQTEALAKSSRNRKSESKKNINIDNHKYNEISYWYEEVKDNFKNLQVIVKPKNDNSGEVKIKYNSLEELKRLLKI
jgi:ParB family chromosome partitioning protein